LIAHANGPTKEGVFYGLKTLTAGDLIQIERGDRAILTFEVVSVETITASKVDMNSLLTSASSDRPGLNLVTAAGNSTERTVVFSILRR
jgi:sortase (surface protein transpeptidase)